MTFALFVRLWLIVTLSAIGGMIVWHLAPILVVVALIAAAFGVFAAIMVAFARWLERRR